MEISLIRVDDRLIHGQVVMGWTQALGIENIVVADDRTAADTMQKTLLMLAVPAGVRASILSVQDAAATIVASTTNEKTLVLVRGPLELKALHDYGVPMSEVNVGNVHTGPGRHRLTREVHATDGEIEVWKALGEVGVRLTAQWLPGQSKTDLVKLIDEQQK